MFWLVSLYYIHLNHKTRSYLVQAARVTDRELKEEGQVPSSALSYLLHHLLLHATITGSDSVVKRSIGTMALFILGDNSTHRSTSLQITHSDVIIATGVY